MCKSLLKTKHLSVIVNCCNPHSSSNSRCKSQREKVTVLDKRDHNIDKLRFLIGTFDWSLLLNCTYDVQYLYDNFLLIVSNLIDAAIPSITVTLGPRDPPYIMPLVKHLLNRRNALRKRGMVVEADILAARINNMIVDIRSHNLRNLEHASSKQLWAAVRTNSSYAKSKNSEINFNPNSVNQYFSNISSSNECTDHNLYASENVNTTFLMPDELIGELLVERRLSSLKPTASGLDGIPFWVLKACSYELSSVIAHIFRVSLISGNVPMQWQKAVVTPVPKVPRPSSISDFRPISVTPILCRALEKIVVEFYLRPAIPTKTLLNQFAFKPTGSTTSALIFITHHVTTMLESNKYVRCLLIDFSKAFDIIEHSLLLRKLQRINLPPYIFYWIKSFLFNRSQVVKIGDDLSNECKITRGIVQGSVMGPVLYTLMASDIELMSDINALCMYPDDTSILAPENTDIPLEQEFNHLRDWAGSNKFVINMSKTKVFIDWIPAAL